jgi:hypothetical protein
MRENMKLSTRLKKSLWSGYFTGYGATTRPVVLMVDCKEEYCSDNLETLDRIHKELTGRGCHLLLNECPVVSPFEIVMHYTSTTYKEWCEA